MWAEIEVIIWKAKVRSQQKETMIAKYKLKL
jgi:hypothetical protein